MCPSWSGSLLVAQFRLILEARVGRATSNIRTGRTGYQWILEDIPSDTLMPMS